ncbi:MAG: signal peptidase II [Bacteroidia bacterium]|nr:signal peptidase II [Bacteroidia bacterium]
MKVLLKIGLLALGIVGVDQASKVYVKLSFPLGHEIPLWGDWLKLHYVENPGAAFGLSLAGLFGKDTAIAEAAPKILLTFFSLLIAVGISYYLVRLSLQEPFIAWPSGLIIGGAFGNLFDRIFYGVIFSHQNAYEGGWFQGHVVDFIYVDIWQGVVPDWVPLWGGEYMALWPIFNIADSCISIGVVWLLLLHLRRKSST